MYDVAMAKLLAKWRNDKTDFAITAFVWGVGEVAKLMAGTDIISIWTSTYSRGVLQEVF